MKATLVYLSYGQSRLYALELTYAVASAVRYLRTVPAEVRIVLVTDEAGRRPDLPVEHLLFTDEMFAEWTRGGTYKHAAKINALAFALDHYGGSVALLDTDTFFTQHPARLFELIAPGRSVMHQAEPSIGKLDYWQPLLDRVSPTVDGFAVSAASPMNNSGVVGIHETDASLLPQMSSLMDKLNAISPVFSIEQFAVTTVLNRGTTISTVPDLVRHYWGFDRRFVLSALSELLPSSTPDAFERLVTDFSELGTPRKRLRDQIAARLHGTIGRWSPDYRFAYLAYLSALSGRVVHEQDAWGATAADLLRQGSFSETRIRRDFKRLIGCRPDWMSASTRAAWIAIAG